MRIYIAYRPAAKHFLESVVEKLHSVCGITQRIVARVLSALAQLAQKLTELSLGQAGKFSFDLEGFVRLRRTEKPIDRVVIRRAQAERTSKVGSKSVFVEVRGHAPQLGAPGGRAQQSTAQRGAARAQKSEAARGALSYSTVGIPNSYSCFLSRAPRANSTGALILCWGGVLST